MVVVVVQVDKHQYVTDESNLIDSMCYMKGCNKVATTQARLKMNEKLEVVVYVCNSCMLIRVCLKSLEMSHIRWKLQE
jgi:hypothetical protein